MVTSIQLGNFFSSGGRTVLGGVGGSGLDTESLITSLADAKRLPATKLEDTITANSKKTDALSEFKTLLSAVKDAAGFLRNPPGVGNQAQNAFLYTNASVVSNTSVAAENYISVSTSPGVSPTTYDISEITSVAHAKKQATGTFSIANADTAVVTSTFVPGYFKSGAVAVNGTDITFAAGDTLNQVAAKFNAVKSSTGISASVIQAGSGSFKLLFTATSTGTDADFDLNPPSAAVPADTSGVFSVIGRTNLVTNGTFDSNITDWTDASLGSGVIAYNGSGALGLDGDGTGGDEAFAQQAITTQIGRQYTVRATLASLANSAYIRVGTDSDVSNPNNYDLANYEVAADGTVSVTFTATSTTTYLTFNSDANTETITVDNVSVVDNTADAFSDTQSASDATFVIDGVTVTRQNNTISDVYSGVTFELKQETPALTTLAATVSADTSIVKNAVVNFINAFNELRLFAAKQSEVDSKGQYKDTAVLSNSTVFRNTVSNITSILSQVVSGITDGDPSRLSEVGITFADLPETTENPLVRNILDLNEGTLATKIAENYDAFRRIFEFDLQSDSPDLRVFSRTNATTISDFTLTIGSATPPTLPTVTATYNNGSGSVDVALDVVAIKDGSTGDVLGYTLKGQSGTVLEGLQLIYSSTDAATIEVTATQGFADKIFNVADQTLSDTGSLKVEQDAISTADTRLQDQIDKIDEEVARFRQQLLDKFSQLEQALSRVNNLLASIDAQNQARNNS